MGWVRKAHLFATRVWLRGRWPWLQRRYRRLTIETIDHVPLLILPDVFNAKLFRGGEFLARTIADHPLFETPDLRVLDMGCGSGVVAVFAARRDAQVTAIDINPDAVRCTRINALLNRVEERVDARVGDLFEPVAGERFDLIIFNPPFFRGRPQSPLDHAWRGEDVFERFAAGLAGRLSPVGRAWLLLSTVGAGDELLALLRREGFAIRVLTQKKMAIETMTIYEVALEASSK
ncbi:MAG: methyltransferase [Chloroflexi bacterium]|nr:methyltransferase [Chloroflexota bacterium]